MNEKPCSKCGTRTGAPSGVCVICDENWPNNVCTLTDWVDNAAKEATARAEIYATQGEDELTKRLVGENQWWAKRLLDHPNCTHGEAWRLLAKGKEASYVEMEKRIERLCAAIAEIKRTTPHSGGYVKIGEICDKVL